MFVLKTLNSLINLTAHKKKIAKITFFYIYQKESKTNTKKNPINLQNFFSLLILTVNRYNNIKRKKSLKKKKKMAGVKDIIKIEFPLHYLIWNNDFVELGEEIKTNEVL